MVRQWVLLYKKELEGKRKIGEIMPEITILPQAKRGCFLNQACGTWFLEIALVHASVCMSVCPPHRALITSGVIWCDVGHVQLVKQVSRIFPAFNYFI